MIDLPTFADVKAATARPETELQAFNRRESRVILVSQDEGHADFLVSADHQSTIIGFDPFQSPEVHDDRTRFQLPA